MIVALGRPRNAGGILGDADTLETDSTLPFQHRDCSRVHELAHVLAAREFAESVGNLPWVLETLAEAEEQRWERRFQYAIQIVRPMLIVAIGLVVALIDFTLPAVLANLGFGLAFAWAASTRDRGWWPAMQCLALGLLSYAAISALIVALAPPLLGSALLVAISLCLAPRFYPKIKAFADVPAVKPGQMYWHKACIGSTVVVLVTYGAELLGHRWGGVLAMFPAMASVMATYYHGREGVASIHFLRGMLKGYWSFSVFCLSLQALLSAFEPYGGPGLCLAFSAAIALALGLQWLLLGRKTGRVSRH